MVGRRREWEERGKAIEHGEEKGKEKGKVHLGASSEALLVVDAV
jgi:hypothetical protein